MVMEDASPLKPLTTSAELYFKPKQHAFHEPRGLEKVKLHNDVVENTAWLTKTIKQQLLYKIYIYKNKQQQNITLQGNANILQYIR